MNAKDFAETVVAQIRAGEVRGARGGQHAMMCWGYNSAQYGNMENGPYIQFKVAGHKHTGLVKIGIYQDEYYICLANSRGKDRDFHQVAEGVYCAELAQVLDTLIET